MRRLILCTTIFLLSFTSFALSLEEADTLFARRGDDLVNASSAALMYEELSRETRDNYTKALMLYKESEAIYYVGTNTGGYWPIEMKGIRETPKDLKAERKAIHDGAVNKIKKVFKLFASIPNSPEKMKLQAQVTYMYGSNLGKWGENNGPLSSLAKWPELKRKMLEIIKMKQAAISNYGAFRVLGRAYYKLPKIGGGSKKKSYQYLKKAHDGSLNNEGVCVHGLNVLFYAETLVALRKKNEAREILQKFIDADSNTLNLSRIPETVGEQEFARLLIDTI